MSHPSCRQTLIALLPLFCCSVAAAQDTALAPVVVTASRMESRISETLADVTVIDRAQIEHNGADTLVDLLARQPGIQMSRSGGPGTQASLYVRGARPDQTKVLIDGLPINSLDLSGSPLYLLPLENVERIEIVRGPASTLYGADAIGGVIQIFTRRGTQGLQADAFLGFGTQSTWQASAGVSGGNEFWRLRAEASHDRTRGISAQTNARNQDADNDAYRNTAGAISVSFLPAKGHELGAIYRRNEGRAYYDSGMTPAESDFDSRMTFHSTQWQLFAKDALTNWWDSTLRYGQTTDWQKNFGEWSPEGSLLETKNTLLSWQNDFTLSGWGRLALGAERLAQEAQPVESFTIDNEASNRAVFAVWENGVGAHHWQLSARHDDHSRFGGQSTYGVAYGLQFAPSLRARASYGTAFKAPSLYQLFDSYSGNENLNPEEATNAEVALLWESGAQNASITFYRNRVRNMIDWDADTYKYMNVSRARLQGVTVEYGTVLNDWKLHAAYDWLDATDADSGMRLGRRARNTFRADVTRNWGALETGVEWVLASSRYDNNYESNRMGGYGLVNLTARYAFSKTLALEARVNNVFDKQYELVRGYGTPGINAFVGIRYTPR